MGRHSAPRRRKPKWWRRHKTTLLLSGILLIAAVAAALLIFTHDPYGELLREAGIPFVKCETDGTTLRITLEGDSHGILACRKVLNTLRAAGNPPETLEWTLTLGSAPLLTGRTERLSFVPPPTSPRVETLEEDMTVLKLKYELEQSGLNIAISPQATLGINGKTISITVECPKDSAKPALQTVAAAIAAVNEEGGGVVRYNLHFTDYGELFAAASYDLYYGDTLFSSFFTQ